MGLCKHYAKTEDEGTAALIGTSRIVHGVRAGCMGTWRQLLVV